MSALMHKARDFREYGAFDRFKSKRIGRLYILPRYAGRRRNAVPLLAYQTRAFRECVPL